jgi:hypothetical protein
MGTWGAGSFENDAVMDWLAELEDGGAKVVRNALDTVADADEDEYLDADDAQAALGAAEIVAAACGKGLDRIEEQDELAAWIAAHGKDFREADVALAGRAVERVLTRSELQELWDEGGPDNEWRPLVGELLRRLRPAARGTAPKQAAAKKGAATKPPAAKKPAPKKPAPKK